MGYVIGRIGSLQPGAHRYIMGHRVIMWPVATSVCPRPDQGAQVREIERIGFGWAFARAVNMPSGEGPAHRELSTHGNPFGPSTIIRINGEFMHVAVAAAAVNGPT